MSKLSLVEEATLSSRGTGAGELRPPSRMCRVYFVRPGTADYLALVIRGLVTWFWCVLQVSHSSTDQMLLTKELDHDSWP